MTDTQHPIVKIQHFGSVFDGREGVLVETAYGTEFPFGVQFPDDFRVYWFDQRDVIKIGNVTSRNAI